MLLVTFHFSNMTSKMLQDRGRIKKTFSNIPQLFYVRDIVIVHSSERKIYIKQIELLEGTPCLLGFDSVDEHIFRKQYGEVNDLDDIRIGEHEIHIDDKKQMANVKWQEEGLDGVGAWKKDKGIEANRGELVLCQEPATTDQFVDAHV